MQIVLIPGLMNDGWVWRHQLGPLSRIAPVHIALTDGCRSLGEMADHILAETAGAIMVVGHSMGGRAALEVVARAPDRVDKLVLLDTGAAPPSPSEAEGRKRLVEIARRDGMAAVAEGWLPPMLSPEARNNRGLIDGIVAMLERCDPESFAGQQLALIHRPDHRPLLPTIACPTLCAAGSEDAWSPPTDHAEMARTIPAGRFAEIKGAGHMLPVEAPEALTRLLADFLTGE